MWKKGSVLTVGLLVCTIMLVGCAKPSDMSSDAYEAAKQAIEVADNYLDMEIEAEDAEQKLDRLESRVNDDSKYPKDSTVKIYILGLKIDMSSASLSKFSSFVNKETGEIDIKIKQARNELAGLIRQKKR